MCIWCWRRVKLAPDDRGYAFKEIPYTEECILKLNSTCKGDDRACPDYKELLRVEKEITKCGSASTDPPGGSDPPGDV